VKLKAGAQRTAGRLNVSQSHSESRTGRPLERFSRTTEEAGDRRAADWVDPVHWFSVIEISLNMLDLIGINNGEGGSPTTRPFACDGLPVRRGAGPETIIGPLHVQCNGHGDPKYLNQLLNDVLSWPHIEPTATSANHLAKVSIRLKEIAATGDSSAFINGTEFGRVLLASPTIILALPLVCAHWAIVKGWAEPHYLQSFGLMPAGTVIVYTPKNRVELEVCYSLFFESYHFACKSVRHPPITQNL
jgi:hypothetical protein